VAKLLLESVFLLGTLLLGFITIDQVPNAI